MEKMTNEQIDAIIAHHGTSPEALVEVLRDLSKALGYLSQDVLLEVAKRLQLPAGQVYAVATFYSLISVKPLGKHVVRMCQDAPCHAAGGRAVWETLEQVLGIKFGETTPDGTWSLVATSCIGLCAVGPVAAIDGEVYGNLTPEKVRELIAQRQAGTATGGAA